MQRTKIIIMETKHQKIPADWAFCFLDGCRRKKECIRYQLGRNLPDDMEICKTVAPPVLGKPSCPRFLKAETVQVAYGFSHIFYDVKSRHSAGMRSAIISRWKRHLLPLSAWGAAFDAGTATMDSTAVCRLRIFRQCGIRPLCRPSPSVCS